MHERHGAPVAVLVILVLSGVQRVLEILPVREWLHLIMHLAIAVIALSATRLGVRWALLKEALDPTEHAVCPDCGPAEPGARFCADCGVALHAFSRSARTAGWAGRSVPATRRRLGLAVGAGVGVLAVVAFGVSTMVTARPARYVCPPDCGAPPIGTPVESNPQFTSADGAFTVSYPGEGTAFRRTFTSNGVVLDFTRGDTGTLELHGEPAQRARRTGHQQRRTGRQLHQVERSMERKRTGHQQRWHGRQRRTTGCLQAPKILCYSASFTAREW